MRAHTYTHSHTQTHSRTYILTHINTQTQTYTHTNHTRSYSLSLSLSHTKNTSPTNNPKIAFFRLHKSLSKLNLALHFKELALSRNFEEGFDHFIFRNRTSTNESTFPLFSLYVSQKNCETTKFMEITWPFQNFPQGKILLTFSVKLLYEIRCYKAIKIL